VSNPIAKLVSSVFGKRKGLGGHVAPADKPLKLRAYDREDFAVVSAVLQDALVPTIDMAWLPDEQRFACVANRFRWERRAPAGDLPDQPAQDSTPQEATRGADSGQLPEAAEEPDARFEDAPLYERVHCGVTFDRVEQVAYRGFSKEASGHVLELLAVVADDQGITVTFAGDAALRLQGAKIVCHLEDLGEPWPTQWRPSHARAEPDSQTGGAQQDTPDSTSPDTTSPDTTSPDPNRPDPNRNGTHT
jgi:hypothetical protein